MSASILEGVNIRVKVIKRTAYGFRDSAYSCQKTKAAFPDKTRWTKTNARGLFGVSLLTEKVNR